jgi:hypothetical protein
MTKIIGLFSTDRAIFKAPYKITCKDKVIFNRLGYFQSLKIAPSLENSPSTQQVTSRRQVIANKNLLPLYLSCFRFLASQAVPPRIVTTTTASVRPLEARSHGDYFLPSVVFPQPHEHNSGPLSHLEP